MPTSVESEGSFPLRFREMVYGVLGSNRTTQSRPSGEIVSSLVTNVKNSLDEFSTPPVTPIPAPQKSHNVPARHAFPLLY